MSENEDGSLRPDGMSVSVPLPTGRIGGAHYWNPGSPIAPHLTFTSTYGMPGAGLHAVFLRHGMTSSDTLGKGVSGNVSTVVPSVTLNGTVPDDRDLIPRPRKSRATSVEAGIGTPNVSPAITNTYTPEQLAGFLLGPAMGPDDELSPFVRTLQSGIGTVGPDNSQPPIRFPSGRYRNALGDGMSDWRSSVDSAYPQYAAQPASSPEQPGGLFGLLLDHLRDNPAN
jgi:hypothetical protein